MSSVLAIGNTALQVLRNSAMQPRGNETAPPMARLVAPTNGQLSHEISIFDAATSSAKSKISDTIFSVTTTSSTQMKLAVFEKTGEALGIRQGDFASSDDYRSAVKDAFAQLKLQDNADQTIAAIEKNLGLDKLGVSLEVVIYAMTEPGGDADKALDAALSKRTQSVDAVESGNSKPVAFKRDDIGIYSPHS